MGTLYPEPEPSAPAGEPSGPGPGSSPATLALAAEIDNARNEFSVFTSRAAALQAAISRGETVTDEQIGTALDKAKAWAEYFSPRGPLCQGFPSSTSPGVYVEAVSSVGQLQRQAQQWADFFTPLWEKRSSSRQELARDEEECIQRAAQAEQAVAQRQMAFTLNSSNLSSQQMQGYIQELNDVLAQARVWLTATKGSACSERLQRLISKITSVQEIFSFSYKSRVAYEAFQRQQGRPGFPGPGMPAGRPGPGSPEWYAAMTGMTCYWCGQDLHGLPQPVRICPHCGRFPQPSP